jgi:aminopeptidase N
VWQALDNLEQAKSNYGPIVYNKAPGVLRQLNHLVGDAAFQRGVRRFLSEHSYGNATWRDLLRAIGTASGRDLTRWGTQWILRPGMPIIEQQLETVNGRIAHLQLRQRPAQPTLSGLEPWPMRLTVLLWYPNAPPVRITADLTTLTTDIVAARGKPAPAFVFANDGDHGYAIVLPDEQSVRWLEVSLGTVRDDLLRAMLWGAMWDLVREARLSPERFAVAAMRALPTERDEQIAAALTSRIGTALSRYGSTSVRDSLAPRLEQLLVRGASDTSLTYGQRKSQLDAFISSAQSPAALQRLDGWLDADSALGLPLRAPTRWSIVTRLLATGAPNAAARLTAESVRDSTTEGRRQAFVAGAAVPDPAAKRGYFARWFSDSTLNEEWVTASLRAFHEPEHAAATLPFLVPSLDTLPWIQRNRRIFFLGAWLGAAIGGQSSPEALSAIDGWLSLHPALPADLRRKVLQARDDLERTVRVRARYGGVAVVP